MAETSLMLLTALRRALTAPEGLPLHGNKAHSGLFPASPAARLLAQRSLDDGLLQIHSADARRAQLTDCGLAWLTEQTSPRHVLEDLVRALEVQQAESQSLRAAAQQIQTTLEGLRSRVEQVLQQLPAQESAPDSWQQNIATFLQRRQAAEDCSLPELYRQTGKGDLSIGAFHDGLRQLHERGDIYLHPWTGPLYALPEPRFALLIGHEIAYYASHRLPLAA